MATKMTKRGQADNEITYEIICDTLEDLNKIEPRYMAMGTVAMVIEGEAGFEVYMANSKKEWINLGGGITAEEEEQAGE